MPTGDDLRSEFAGLRSEFAGMRADIASFRREMRAWFAVIITLVVVAYAMAQLLLQRC
jgi:hypothetical protein